MSDADKPDLANWTIKAVPVGTRLKAVRCAQAADQTVGEWIAEAVERMAHQQANMVLPPAEPPGRDAPAPSPWIDLPGLAAALQATAALAAAAGMPPPRGLAREASATLRQYMRAARGLPDRQTNAARRQTVRLLESDPQPER
jgi:hypothetical protein